MAIGLRAGRDDRVANITRRLAGSAVDLAKASSALMNAGFHGMTVYSERSAAFNSS